MIFARLMASTSITVPEREPSTGTAAISTAANSVTAAVHQRAISIARSWRMGWLCTLKRWEPVERVPGAGAREERTMAPPPASPPPRPIVLATAGSVCSIVVVLLPVALALAAGAFVRSVPDWGAPGPQGYASCANPVLPNTPTLPGYAFTCGLHRVLPVGAAAEAELHPLEVRGVATTHPPPSQTLGPSAQYPSTSRSLLSLTRCVAAQPRALDSSRLGLPAP
jgi:hypothetical protein